MSSKEWIRWQTEKPLFRIYGADEIELPHSDLTGVTADQHHAQLHHATHEDAGDDEIDLTAMSGTEIRLIPKASSSGAEGTIFYASADNHVYVATE